MKRLRSQLIFVSNFPADLRIVLLGRFKNGKTSACNTILGGPKFDTCDTKTCKTETGIVDGQKVTVVDTPGLFRPGTTEEDVLKEIKKSIDLASPGPHVFLIVLKVNDPFTEEQQQTVKLICSTFGQNTLAYTMVLFTYGNRLENVPIEDYFCGDSNLHNLIIQCHWKYHVFDNTQNNDQVKSLLDKINGMIERSRGSCYTSEMFQKAEKAEQQQQQQAQNPEAEGKKAKRGPVETSALFGVCVGCLMGYLVGDGQITSSIGALLGGLAGITLGVVVAGLWILGKRHIKKCPQKCCC